MAFGFGPRRGTYTDVTKTLSRNAGPLALDEVGQFETLDLVYRSLCALLYNYVRACPPFSVKDLLARQWPELDLRRARALDWGRVDG